MFRQESNFQYLLGVKEPDCYATIRVSDGHTTLFIPRLPASYAVWMGAIMPPSHFKDLYKVDHACFEDEIDSVVGAAVSEYALAHAPKQLPLLTLHGLNTDSGNYATPATFKGIEKYRVDDGVLYNSVVKCRVYKSPEEIELLRYVNDVSCDAHMAVMTHIKPGYSEYQMESVFNHWCYFRGGARFNAYTCICGSGSNGAVLHYGHAGEPNSKVIRDNEMCLFDMGCEFHCYASDVTCSFPSSGKFTPKMKVIYEAVLAAQWNVMDAMKPGVSWVDMHDLAYRTILSHLREAGLVVGEIDELMENDIGAVFMPHGLGHFMGIDVHDVGGYAPNCPLRKTKPGFKSLRTARILEESMCITVEPGIYFGDYNLDAALSDPVKSRFLVADKVNEYRGFGGVRLEDDVLVTKDGIENLSSAPRLVKDVEDTMSGKITSRSQVTKKHYRKE